MVIQNDNNNSVHSTIALLVPVLAVIFYKKNPGVLNQLQEQMHKSFRIAMLGIAALVIGWISYAIGNIIHQKILELQKWIADINKMLNQHEENIQSQWRYIHSLRDRTVFQGKNIQGLIEKIDELKENFEPRKDAVKVEAIEKVEEAIQQVLESAR